MSFCRRCGVQDYPAFVPWCSGARIRRADDHEILADPVIGFGPFQESFTSEGTRAAHRLRFENQQCSVRVSLLVHFMSSVPITAVRPPTVH